MELSSARKLLGSVCSSCGATFLHCQFIGEVKCFEWDDKQFNIALPKDFSLFIVHVLDPHEGECAYISVKSSEIYDYDSGRPNGTSVCGGISSVNSSEIIEEE